MRCFAPGVGSAAILCLPKPSICISRKKKNGGLHAKLNDGNDPFLQSAINGASLRLQETQRPEPLFIDPYAGCFVTHDDVQKDMSDQSSLSRSSSSHYCLATKFIDDKLLTTMNKMDELRQVVLFTDGMDTRPYRLKWPNSTVIFDISPERVFQTAAQKLKGVGAKIPRSCLLIHIPSDSIDVQKILYRKGFNGNKSSIWALQGLPMMTLENFKDIMVLVGSLATKGCIFVGELPAWLLETEATLKNWMDKFFMSNGFQVNVIQYEEVAKKLGRETPSRDFRNILFVAKQLRLSDGQMESWRREFQRVEEEGDEDGFEEF